ncbi:hypothetical protein [Tellurirhabdus rosea]|uniref:hypothetical protein n=1 Tax=Tellurirhabdus rosea TaxID=2674997 RepID=UPI00224F6AD9|nr:hypothetical protein [Tellurirhabdus rosea]
MFSHSDWALLAAQLLSLALTVLLVYGLFLLIRVLRKADRVLDEVSDYVRNRKGL